MDFSNIDLEDLIVTFSVQDLFPTYLWPIPILACMNRDSAPLDEPIEVIPPPNASNRPSLSSYLLELRS